MSKKQISSERKTLYMAGVILTGIGMLLFLSTFLVFLNPNSFFNTGNPFGFMIRPFVGILMIAGGNFMRILAARGTAGSGLVLDPEKAREDLRPWTSMAGSMVQDALEETTLNTKKESIKIRCQNCTTLNDEDSKFCKSCGKSL